MDENHRDKTESKLTAIEDKLSPPPLSTKDHKGPHRTQDNRMGTIIKSLGFSIIKSLGFFGYDKETKEYTPDGQLAKITKEHQPGKTLWDLLQLLGVIAIPIAVVLFGATFSANIAHQQSEASFQIARDQEHETELQQYLDSMSGLLTNKDLQDPIKGVQLREVARARTVIALATLDGWRKGIVLQFLLQSNLINRTNTIVDLRRINLEEILLRRANLIGINLSGADLTVADLSGDFLNNTDLRGAYLIEADLSGADLTGADLSGADLTGADLSGANLSGAFLLNAVLTGANLSDALSFTQQQLDQVKTCKNAILPQGLTCHRNQSQ